MGILYLCIFLTILFLLIMLPRVIKLILIFIVIYMYILVGIYIFYNIFYYRLFIQINRIIFSDKVIIVILFISLGGIPPLLGFLRKFLILKIVLVYENIFLFLIIIFSSLVLLYHYISRIYFFLTFIPSIKIRFSTNNFSWVKFIYIISLIFFNFIFAFIL